jgi:hypothetical protein
MGYVLRIDFALHMHARSSKTVTAYVGLNGLTESAMARIAEPFSSCLPVIIMRDIHRAKKAARHHALCTAWFTQTICSHRPLPHIVQRSGLVLPRLLF